jgi:hypothetical protein
MHRYIKGSDQRVRPIAGSLAISRVQCCLRVRFGGSTVTLGSKIRRSSSKPTSNCTASPTTAKRRAAAARRLNGERPQRPNRTYASRPNRARPSDARTSAKADSRRSSAERLQLAGLHLVVPLSADQGWADVKAFSKALTRHMAKVIPSRFSAVAGQKNRVGKIFFDYLRNGNGATSVAALSVRARPGMPVARTDTSRSGAFSLKRCAHKRYTFTPLGSRRRVFYVTPSRAQIEKMVRLITSKK